MLRLLAVIVIAFIGLSMILPQFNRILEILISRISQRFSGSVKQRNGFSGGFITGLSLGIVWSPCAGPILAAIATLAATGMVNSSVFFLTVAYVTGIGIPLFFFSYAGQLLVTKSRVISAYTGQIQKVFGVIMLLTALAIYTNFDTLIQLKLLNMFPALDRSLTSFENNQDVKNQLDIIRGKQTTNATSTANLFNSNSQAPDFVGITKWLNPDNQPLTMQSLRGKVVLVDFWTYTCINCIRTLPFVTSWYDKYKNDGFVVVGVHTPEFQFEHDSANVLNAIKQYNIHYPVAQDNDYKTWTNFSNQYWPAEYLIDSKGIVRRVHFGEGEYDTMEQAIRQLLKEKGANVQAHNTSLSDQTPKGNISPETYVGSARMQFFYPDANTGNVSKNFVIPSTNPVNSFVLGGMWTITSENALSGNNAVLSYHFNANKVFIVLSPGKGNPKATIKVFIDNQPPDQTNQGTDVTNGIVTVDSDRLYNIIDLKGNTADHVLQLIFQTPNTEAFAFTFG